MAAHDVVLTVATLNLLGYQARPEERWPLLVSGLAREAPDLLALQEVAAEQGIGTRLQQALTHAVSLYHYVEHANARNRELNVGILSRHPLLAQHWVDLGGQGRVALGVLATVADVPLGFVSTHLFWEPGPAGEAARRYQAGVLADWVARTFAGVPTIVAGDFNATPDGPTYAFLTERWASLYARRHGVEPAWTTPTPLLPAPDGWRGTLDYLFLAPRDAPVRVLDAWLALDAPAPGDPTLYPSDHVAVVARVAIDRARA